MAHRPVHRLTTTLLVVLSLLLSQLALANYVCPPAEPARVDHAAMVMEMAPGQPCESMAGMQMDTEQPVLCHQHCVDAPQSFDPVQVPSVSLPAVVLVLVVPATVDAQASKAASTADAGQARPPPDPLFLSTLRLRV
jgi:hypothetical protein